MEGRLQRALCFGEDLLGLNEISILISGGRTKISQKLFLFSATGARFNDSGFAFQHIKRWILDLFGRGDAAEIHFSFFLGGLL
jgi:hypothetical protein